MSSRTCPFQHSCLVNYVARKDRRSHRGSPRIEARVVINIMRAERGDPSVWKEVERGVAEFDIEPSMPRTTGRQQQRDE